MTARDLVLLFLRVSAADITVALTETSYLVEEDAGSVTVCVRITHGAVADDFDIDDIRSVTVIVAAAERPVPGIPATSENCMFTFFKIRLLTCISGVTTNFSEYSAWV